MTKPSNPQVFECFKHCECDSDGPGVYGLLMGNSFYSGKIPYELRR